MDEVLKYPDPVPRKTSKRAHEASAMPSHLTSDQAIEFLEEKKRRKKEKEDEKARKKAEREAQRQRKKVERELKVAERERRRVKKRTAISRNQSRGRGRRQGKSLSSTGSQERSVASTAPTSSWSDESNSDTDEADTILCPCCGEDDESKLWVQCDSQACHRWYHAACTDIDPEEYGDLEAITWFCDNCC